MISELAGADFMINSVESKMLWWHFNSDSTDLKAMEPGSCGQAHKLHDNVDPTQRGDLLFIFKSLGYLGIDWFHHAGIDVVIALRGMAEQCGWYEWVEGAFEPFCGPAFLSLRNQLSTVTAPLKMRLHGMDNSIPKGPVRYIQPELTNEKQERDLSVYFAVNIDLQLLLAWAYGFYGRRGYHCYFVLVKIIECIWNTQVQNPIQHIILKNYLWSKMAWV